MTRQATSERTPAENRPPLALVPPGAPTAPAFDRRVFRAALVLVVACQCLFFFHFFHARGSQRVWPWMTAELVVAVAGLAVAGVQVRRLSNRVVRRRLHLAALLLLILPAAAAVATAGLRFRPAYTGDVALVYNGRMPYDESRKVGAALDDYMADTTWAGIVADDGRHLVNVSGEIIYGDKAAQALLQFTVDPKSGVFELQAFELDGNAMPNLAGSVLIKKALDTGTGR